MASRSTTKSVSPKTLTDFIEEFARYSSGSDYLKCFRGQQDSSWPNVAGIFRPDLKELLKNEKRAVRELISESTLFPEIDKAAARIKNRYTM